MAKAEVTFTVRARNATKRALRSVAVGFKKLAQSAVRLAKMGAAAFVGMSIALLRAAKSAQELNKQLGQITTLASIPMKDLKKEVMDVSAEFGLAKDELTKGLYDALSAGVPKENAFDFLRTAAKAAIAGAGTTAEAVDLLTTSLNAFKIPASNAEKVADTLFTTVRLGKTTLSELSSAMATVAPLANASGISLEEVAAATATLTKQGTDTKVAMTQIRRVIIALNEQLGDGWSSTMTFNEGVKELADRANGSQVALKNMIGRIEGVVGVLGLTGVNAEMAASDFDEVKKSVGAANDAFAKMKDLNDLDKVIQNIDNLFKTLGDATLVALSDEIQELLKWARQVRSDGSLEKWGEDATTAVMAVVDAIGLAIDQIKLLGTFAGVLSESGLLSFKSMGKRLIPVVGIKNSIQDLRKLKDVIDEAGEVAAEHDAARIAGVVDRLTAERKAAAEKKQTDEEKKKRADQDAADAEKAKQTEIDRQMELREEQERADAEKKEADEKEKSRLETLNALERERLSLEEKRASIMEEMDKADAVANIDAQIKALDDQIAATLAENIPKRAAKQVEDFIARRKERGDVEEENAKREKKLRELEARQLKGQSITKRGREMLAQNEAFKAAQKEAKRLADEQKLLQKTRDLIQRDIRGELQDVNLKLAQNLQAADM